MAFWHWKKSKFTSPSFIEGDTEGFWTWFRQNESALWPVFTAVFEGSEGDDAANDALAAALTKFHPGLVFEVGRAQDGLLDLVISADGDFSRFPAVLELVGKSQTSKKFIVTAFRQRRAGLSLSIHGEEFQDETVRFHMLPSQSHDGKFDLTIFMGQSSLDSEQLARAAFILLDTTIGEYDMETLIGAVEVCRSPPASDGQLLPLSELPRILDEGLLLRTQH